MRVDFLKTLPEDNIVNYRDSFLQRIVYLYNV